MAPQLPTEPPPPTFHLLEGLASVCPPQASPLQDCSCQPVFTSPHYASCHSSSQCVHVCAYMCAYVYVCKHCVYVCAHGCMRVCVQALRLCTCVHIHEHLCVCVCMCVCVHALCVHMCACTYASICMCAHMGARVYVCEHCVYACKRCVYVCTCACVHVVIHDSCSRDVGEGWEQVPGVAVPACISHWVF